MKTTTLGLAVLVLVSLFFVNATTSVSNLQTGEYDHWLDLNDDGKIDIFDVVKVAGAYGTTGTPINKTALLLELQARLDNLNATVQELETTINGLNNTIISLYEMLLYLNSTGLDSRKYDSGWFAVGKNSDYDKVHDLGTTSLVVSVWFSKASDGSERCYGPAPLSWRKHNPEHVSGVTVAEITITTIRIRTGNDFRIPSASPGSDANENLSSGYVRIIAIAID